MFCTKCGKEIMDEAVICPHCGCETGNGFSKKVSNDYVSIIAKRLHTNAVIWIAIAVVQLIIGLLGSWFTIIVGALNLYSAIQDINFSKSYEATPIGLIDRVKPITGAVITLIYNLLIGGIIGVIGSIYYFVAVRGYVLENENEFLKIEEKAKGEI